MMDLKKHSSESHKGKPASDKDMEEGGTGNFGLPADGFGEESEEKTEESEVEALAAKENRWVFWLRSRVVIALSPHSTSGCPAAPGVCSIESIAVERSSTKMG